MNVCSLFQKNNSTVELFARIFLAAGFFMGGVSKFMNIDGTVAYMSAFGVPMAEYLVYVAAVFLLVSSVALVVGWKKCIMAGLLAAYTVLVSIIFHLDWGDPQQMVAFLKNVGLVGGLFMLVLACKDHGSSGSNHPAYAQNSQEM